MFVVYFTTYTRKNKQRRRKDRGPGAVIQAFFKLFRAFGGSFRFSRRGTAAVSGRVP